MSCPSPCHSICANCLYFDPSSPLYRMECGLSPEFCQAERNALMDPADRVMCSSEFDYLTDDEQPRSLANIISTPRDYLYCEWVDKFICPYDVDEGQLINRCSSCRFHLVPVEEV